MTYHLPAGKALGGPYVVDVTPEKAGWGYSSLRVLELPPGGTHTFDTGDSEWIVLPLSGGCTVAAADDFGHDTFELTGRDSVFSSVSDFAYVPRDARATVTSAGGGRFALTGARCTRRLPARYGPASSVPVELRGTGNSSRQVNNFGAAARAGGADGQGFECDKLIAVEVITPGGNWSSFPPHKHDEASESESRLEEVYYFESDSSHPAGRAGACGYQRVYGSGPGKEIDVTAEVRTGDAILIPYGWHGPAMAAPGYDLYYLNVMAGPEPERAWLICDHPDHAWVRSTWPEQPVDPRLPLYTAPEKS